MLRNSNILNEFNIVNYEMSVKMCKFSIQFLFYSVLQMIEKATLLIKKLLNEHKK